MTLTICALAVCLWTGCHSKPALPSDKTGSMTPLDVSFIPVDDPVSEMCYDDTHSRTEWFNVPNVRFSGNAIVLNGRTTTANDLREWAKKYYEHKVERGLWVQIAPGDVANAERVLIPVVQMFPDLQVRQVEFGFSCPKIRP